MTILAAIFAATMSFSAMAQTDQPVLKPLDRATAFFDINPRGASALTTYFTDVSSLSEGLFLTHPSLGFGPFHCTRLVEAPKSERCPAIFCQDAEFYKRVQNELSGKRLVLLTHAFNPFNGIAFSDTPAVVRLKAYFPAVDQKKSALVISPNMNLYSYEHELVHTRDFESGILSRFNAELSEWLKAQKISRALALAARDLVREVRAYDVERQLLQTPRATEYQLNVAKARSTMEIEVQEVSGVVFASNQLSAIDEQVKDVLAPQFAKALVGTEDEARRHLLERMRELLPSDGPYSLVGLGF